MNLGYFLDPGILVTGIAAWAAFLWRRGVWIWREPDLEHKFWLRHMLLLLWAVITVETVARAYMATVVATQAIMDLAVAGTALAVATHNPARVDARIIGGISMALMPLHWTMAFFHGKPNWALYAIICNMGFIAQCLILGGWLDGVGRCISNLLSRAWPLFLFRSRK